MFSSFFIKFLKFNIIFFVLISSISCATKVVEVQDPNKAPDWIYNSSYNGKIGGVGYSRTHIKGINAQRELATRRALEDIARQKGVRVDSQMEIHSTSKSSGTQGSNSSSIVTITNQRGIATIKAKVRAVWINPSTKEMYVHMVEE